MKNTLSDASKTLITGTFRLNDVTYSTDAETNGFVGKAVRFARETGNRGDLVALMTIGLAAGAIVPLPGQKPDPLFAAVPLPMNAVPFDYGRAP